MLEDTTTPTNKQENGTPQHSRSNSAFLNIMEIDLTDSPSATSVCTPTESALHIHKRRRTDDEIASGRRSDDLEGEDSDMPHPQPKGSLDVSSTNGPISSSRTTIAMSEPPQWQKVIENTVKAIVSIRFSQVSAFDTEGNERSIMVCSRRCIWTMPPSTKERQHRLQGNASMQRFYPLENTDRPQTQAWKTKQPASLSASHCHLASLL